MVTPVWGSLALHFSSSAAASVGIPCMYVWYNKVVNKQFGWRQEQLLEADEILYRLVLLHSIPSPSLRSSNDLDTLHSQHIFCRTEEEAYSCLQRFHLCCPIAERHTHRKYWLHP